MQRKAKGMNKELVANKPVVLDPSVKQDQAKHINDTDVLLPPRRCSVSAENMQATQIILVTVACLGSRAEIIQHWLRHDSMRESPMVEQGINTFSL